MDRARDQSVERFDRRVREVVDGRPSVSSLDSRRNRGLYLPQFLHRLDAIGIRDVIAMRRKRIVKGTQTFPLGIFAGTWPDNRCEGIVAGSDRDGRTNTRINCGENLSENCELSLCRHTNRSVAFTGDQKCNAHDIP